MDNGQATEGQAMTTTRRRADKADEADKVSIATKGQNQRGRDSDESVAAAIPNDSDLGNKAPRTNESWG